MDSTFTWPSTLVNIQRQNSAANQQRLATPDEQMAMNTQHSNTQPDLYLQVSRLLGCEIWNHNRTRAELVGEIQRRTSLEVQMAKQMQDLIQWQQACDAVYASLDEHRAERTKLKREIEGMETELKALRERLSPTFSEHEDKPEPDHLVTADPRVLFPKPEQNEYGRNWHEERAIHENWRKT